MAALGSIAKAGAKAGSVGAKAGAKSMKVGSKAAKTGAKSGSKAAKSGAKSGAKAAGDAGSAAAKSGAKSGAKAAGDAGSAAAKSGAKSGAKAAGDVGAEAAKAGAKNPKLLKYAATAAIVGGGALYLDKKLKDQSQAIKDCVQVCLPEGYDGVAFGGKPASTLQYRTLDSLKAKGADVSEDQPLCTADVGECGEFCSTKCKEANPLDVPGAGVAGAAVDAVKGATSFLGKGIWSAIKIPVMIMCALITIAIIAKIAMSGKSAAPPPPPRYY
ncbi:hypothetical protein [Dishui Lake phycodnavirus 3]|nr:hypothetical protein [Dishui Lake phycodnavirus 3]